MTRDSRISAAARRFGMHIATACVLAVVLFAGDATLVCAQTPGDRTTAYDALPPPKPAKLMVTTPLKTARERRFYGRVTARQTVNLAFQVSGQIVSFSAVEGTFYKSGAILARLNKNPFEHALSQAKLILAQAERKVARNDRLLKTKSIALVEAEDAKTARDLAKVRLQNAKEALSDAVLRAPFNGMVADRIVAKYTTVTRGQAVVRIHDLSELRVEISVPERLISSFSDPSKISFEAVLTPGGSKYPLQLREFIPETKSIGQSYIVTLAFAGTVPKVLPGASATVIAKLPTRGGAGIRIPPTAVVILPNRGAAVMVFEPTGASTGRVALTLVKVQTHDGSSIIVTKGLKPGQEIVVAGAHLLNDGQRVRRFTGYAARD